MTITSRAQAPRYDDVHRRGPRQARALPQRRPAGRPGDRDLRRRVTAVSGPRPRVNSVLTYGEHPEMKLNELTQKLFYGRTA